MSGGGGARIHGRRTGAAPVIRSVDGAVPSASKARVAPGADPPALEVVSASHSVTDLSLAPTRSRSQRLRLSACQLRCE